MVEDLGRGVRERSNISYADNLTDQEFMRAVESGQLDEALEQKRAGKRLRRGTPASAAGTPSALPKGKNKGQDMTRAKSRESVTGPENCDKWRVGRERCWAREEGHHKRNDQEVCVCV